MYEGTIVKVIETRGFGFIASPGQVDFFFHCHDIGDGLEWGEVLTGQRVTFDIAQTPKGSRAVNVRAAV